MNTTDHIGAILALDSLKDIDNSSNTVNNDEILRLMNFILYSDDKKLYTAVIDVLSQKNSIIEISTGIGSTLRTCWAVPGSKDSTYLCLPEYCPCRSFFELRLKWPEDEIILCKHLIAIRFSSLLNQSIKHIVNEEKYCDIISGKLFVGQIVAEVQTNQTNETDQTNPTVGRALVEGMGGVGSGGVTEPQHSSLEHQRQQPQHQFGISEFEMRSPSERNLSANENS